MGKKRDKLDLVQFSCLNCGNAFEAEPDRIEDAPEDPWHPWQYWSECDSCGEEAPQSARERGLLKAWASATGPKTEEGRARSAANLPKELSPDVRARTRYNALKHGAYAKTLTYFPARPGSYPECPACPYRESLCQARWVENGACQHKTEKLLEFMVAFESGDATQLREQAAFVQWQMYEVLQRSVHDILVRGPAWESQEWYSDKDGGCHAAIVTDEYGQKHAIKKVEAHPLMGVLKDLTAKQGYSLVDAAMTMRQRDEVQALKGHLNDDGADKESLAEAQATMARNMESLLGLIEGADKRAAEDPVLRQMKGALKE